MTGYGSVSDRGMGICCPNYVLHPRALERLHLSLPRQSRTKTGPDAAAASRIFHFSLILCYDLRSVVQLNIEYGFGATTETRLNETNETL